MIDIKISSCTVGTWATNSYLISYQDDFIIVDPGDDFQKLENF
jgi:flavorubredoxin